MLDFIDRFADPRFVADPQLRCAAIWVGTTEDESALVEYLSPEDPGAGQFAADAGEEYDPDFLDAEHRERRPVDDLLAEIADTHHLGSDDLSRLREATAQQGITVSNTHIVLEQHAYRGDEQDFHGLMFVGNIEYQQPEPQSHQRFSHLFVGITTAPALHDLRQYVGDGELTAELGVQLADEEYYGYRLRQGDQTLTPRDFFALPLVRDRIRLEDSLPEVERTCREHGLETVNAFISGSHGGDARLPVAPGDRFAGLHYLGVFVTTDQT